MEVGSDMDDMLKSAGIKAQAKSKFTFTALRNIRTVWFEILDAEVPICARDLDSCCSVRISLGEYRRSHSLLEIVGRKIFAGARCFVFLFVCFCFARRA